MATSALNMFTNRLILELFNKILSHEGLVEALVDLYGPWSRVSFSPEDKHVDVGSAQTSPPADWESRAGGWAFAGQCRTL